MSSYYLRQLEQETGCRWRRDYSDSDPSALFRKLERKRASLGRFRTFERTLHLARVLGFVATVAGIGLSVGSSLMRVDAGDACGALIGFGIPVAVIGFVASLVMTFFLEDERAELDSLQDAYDEALEAKVNG